jgi:uncharacterized alkaline shock family protein YloU
MDGRGPTGATSAATLPPPTGASPVPAVAAPPGNPGTTGNVTGDRGTLRLAPGVVARIAEVAASRVPGVMPVFDDVVAVPSDPMVLGAAARATDPSVSASADVHADAASVHVTIGVVWPTPVNDVAAAVARAVTDEVRRLAGVTIERVDVEIAAIGTPPRRRVR